MGKIMISIDSSELNCEVKKLIEDRFIQILRNDTQLGEMMEDVLKEEVGKRVSKVLLNYEGGMDGLIHNRIISMIPTQTIIAQATMRVIKDEVRATIAGSQTDQIKKVLKTEINEMICSQDATNFDSSLLNKKKK